MFGPRQQGLETMDGAEKIDIDETGEVGVVGYV